MYLAHEYINETAYCVRPSVVKSGEISTVRIYAADAMQPLCDSDIYELRILAKDDNAACECDEKLDVTERANARERAEKAGQRLEIKVAEVFRVGRNDEGSADRRNQSDREDGIGVQEIAYSRDGSVKKNAERRSEIARFFRMGKNVLSSDRMCHFKNLPVLRSQTYILYHIPIQNAIPFL